MKVTASLVTIGDELLIGQIVDTNSAYIAKALNRIGVEVQEILSVKDEQASIIEAIERSLSFSPIVIMTGGLGPTKDDITKAALCEYLHCDLVQEPSVLENIKHLFAQRGYKELNNLNQDQALVPQKSMVIQNKLGTAPCLWTEVEGKVLINLPGVPFEMKQLIDHEIIPRLKQTYQQSAIVHHDLLVSGIPESDLAILLEDWENNLPDFIHLAYLPNRASIDLRFSAVGEHREELIKAIEEQIGLFKQVAGQYLVAENSGSIAQIVGEVLNQKDLTIATAESCTGGHIAHLLTSVSGSSAYFKGSVVAYTADVKEKVLNVSPALIAEKTVVSREVAEQMAMGAIAVLGTSIAVSTTGVAGPNKGEDGKDIGTVWVSVTNGQQMLSKAYFYPYLDREDFIKIVSQNALGLVVEFVKSHSL